MNVNVLWTVSLGVLSVGAIMACSDDITCPAGSADPAVLGPVLIINPVSTANPIAPVDTFRVSNIQLDGSPLSGAPVSILCSRSCGFGADSGTYTFTISAPPQRDTTLTVNAFYGIVGMIDGQTSHGCTVYRQRGGTTISVILPESA